MASCRDAATKKYCCSRRSALLRGGILRVENLGDVLGLDLRLDGVEVFGLVEGEQVEFVVALGAPQAQRVDAAGCVAGDHVVDGHGAHGPGRLPDLLAVLFDDFAAEGDLLGTVVVDVAPGLFVGQPVVRLLDLLAVLVEGLLEDAVLVLDAVAERGYAEGCERVDEAGGETAEAAVAEARLVFDVDDVLRLEARSLTASLNWSIMPALSSALRSCLPMRNSADRYPTALVLPLTMSCWVLNHASCR